MRSFRTSGSIELQTKSTFPHLACAGFRYRSHHISSYGTSGGRWDLVIAPCDDQEHDCGIVAQLEAIQRALQGETLDIHSTSQPTLDALSELKMDRGNWKMTELAERLRTDRNITFAHRHHLPLYTKLTNPLIQLAKTCFGWTDSKLVCGAVELAEDYYLP